MTNKRFFILKNLQDIGRIVEIFKIEAYTINSSISFKSPSRRTIKINENIFGIWIDEDEYITLKLNRIEENDEINFEIPHTKKEKEIFIKWAFSNNPNLKYFIYGSNFIKIRTLSKYREENKISKRNPILGSKFNTKRTNRSFLNYRQGKRPFGGELDQRIETSIKNRAERLRAIMTENTTISKEDGTIIREMTTFYKYLNYKD